MASSDLRILVIVVTYNGMKWVDRCLGSIRRSVMPADVIVIDNGSVDGSCEYIRTNYPEVRLHCTGENFGFGKANNIGFEIAVREGYDYVYLLNQDAWVFPDTFSSLVTAMEADRSYGVLSPMQMAADSDRPDPRFQRRCPEAALNDWKNLRTGASVTPKIYEVKFVMAAHWMISRACLLKVGGFSPSFSHYGEDDNYLHRARYHQFRCGILSVASAIHDREMRPMTKEASMRLKCVASVVKISNPLNCLIWRLMFQPVELLAIAVRYSSPYVLRQIITLLKKYPVLVRNRRLSRSPGAFL